MKSKTLQYVLAAIVVCLLVISCRKNPPINPPPMPPVDTILAPPPFGFYVIGYFPSYRVVAEYADSMFKMCNVINYAFFSVNATGTIDVANQPRFDSVYAKAKTNGAKVFMSINNAANFKTMAATPAGRHNFIKDVMSKARALQVDGVDIDWEYPRTTDGTDTTFTALMKELSDSLHMNSKFYLSAAITPGRYAGSVRDAIKDELFNYVDFFNIMVYDDFTTDPRFPYKHHSDMNLVTYCLNYWLNTRNMPRQKCVLGIPAYGRNSGAAQVATSYKTIVNTGVSAGPAPLHLSDSAFITQSSGAVIKTYYNGQPTVKAKTIYAKNLANGVMFWEIGHDANNSFSLIKAACDTIGRAY